MGKHNIKTADERLAIANEYVDDEKSSSVTLAAKHGISVTQVMKILKEHNVRPCRMGHNSNGGHTVVDDETKKKILKTLRIAKNVAKTLAKYPSVKRHTLARLSIDGEQNTIVYAHGLTPGERGKIVTKLGGNKCKICETVLEEREAQVDHCHTTGFVRGILCRRCNSVLGNVEPLLTTDKAIDRFAAYLKLVKDTP